MWEPFRKLGEKIQLTVVGTVIGASANACCVKVSFDTDHTVFCRLDKDGNVDQIPKKLLSKNCPKCSKMTLSPVMSKTDVQIGELCTACNYYLEYYLDR